MATNFPTPPTFANPIVVNPQTGENQFNPIWLNWFLVLANFLGSSTQGRIRDVVPVTSSGVYNPSNGTNNVLVALWGGGGGGGGAATTTTGQISVGGGGGAGGFCFSILTSGFTGATLNIGGAGAAGGAGGATTFVGLTAGGGNPGATGALLTAAGFTLGGKGGTSSGGTLNGQAQGGGLGIALSTTQGASGQGAGSLIGCGGLPGFASQAPGTASGFGAGGAGAVHIGTSNVAGTSGTIGCAFIMELHDTPCHSRRPRLDDPRRGSRRFGIPSLFGGGERSWPTLQGACSHVACS